MIRNLIIVLLGAAALAGCGNRPAVGKEKNADWQGFGDAGGQIPGPNADGDPNDDPNLTPVIEKPVSLYGSSQQVVVSVQTLNKLKVRFRPTPNEKNDKIYGTNTLSGYRANYSKLELDIKVGQQTKNTNMVSNGVLGNAQWSYEMDFSSALSAIPITGGQNICLYGINGVNQCSIQGGTRTVSIRLKNAQYDWTCTQGNGYSCIQQGYEFPVRSNHNWNGVLYIETDFTESLNTVYFQ